MVRTRQALIGAVVLAMAGAMLPACVQTTSTSFVRGSDSRVEYAYVNPKADFSRYDSLTTDGLEIYFPSNMPAPAPEDIERIRASFRRAFTEAIGDDYPIVDEPGLNVLKVRAQLVDMKVTGAEGDFVGRGRLKNIVGRGELTFVMEMIDSVSGEVLARAGDQTHDATGREGEAGWPEVDAAAEYWAGLFRDWLDRSLAGNDGSS